MSLTLKNPHSVLAILQTRPADVLEVRTNTKTANDAWKTVADTAYAHRIPVRAPLAPARDARSKEAGRIGGSEAIVRERQGAGLPELFATDATRGLWIALDHIQDPHNAGAIFRTAAFFGVKGIILTKDQSVPLTATVYDVASGGLEFVPFVVLPNMVRAIEVAKEKGLWVLGTSEHTERDITQVDRDRKWLMVVGNEESGLRRLVAEHCDEMCRLTPRGTPGGVTSLNVSAAAAIMISALA